MINGVVVRVRRSAMLIRMGMMSGQEPVSLQQAGHK